MQLEKNNEMKQKTAALMDPGMFWKYKKGPIFGNFFLLKVAFHSKKFEFKVLNHVHLRLIASLFTAHKNYLNCLTVAISL